MHENASGAQFREAADDFITPSIKGDTYKLYFDMADIKSLSELTTFIEKRVNGLKMYGYDVTDVYFFDHSAGTDGVVEGLYFGETVYVTALEIEDKGKDLAWDRILPAEATVHFRNCSIGSENNRDLLQNLATWTNRTVTGGTGLTIYSYPHNNENGNINLYDPSWEEDGADYTYGSLWGASPGGAPEEIWPAMVYENYWFDPLGIVQPQLVKNPVPQPY